MKGIISGIKRMEIHDGDGIRTTVFMKGCPLKCIWCHNPESLSFKPQIAYFHNKCIKCGNCISSCKNNLMFVKNGNIESDFNNCPKECFDCANACPVDARVLFGKEYDVDELVEIILLDRNFFKSSGGGVTISGGECLSQPEFTIELARKLSDNGISVNIDTCGYINTDILERIMPYTDMFLYDIKAIDSDVHCAITGKNNELILDNLRFLLLKGAKIEIRVPLVQGVNDGEIKKIGEFLSSFKNPPKIKVLQYHSFAKSRYQALGLECTLPDVITTKQDVENAVNILKKYNLNAINGIIED